MNMKKTSHRDRNKDIALVVFLVEHLPRKSNSKDIQDAIKKFNEYWELKNGK